jgi:hypothetical protein
MTPEQLAEIPGIGPKMTEKIQIAVNSYYSQFEEGEVPPQYEAEAPPLEPAMVSGGTIAPPLQIRPIVETVEAPLVTAAAVMPGLPVEGEDTEAGEEEYEDFDTISAGEAAAGAASEPEENSPEQGGVDQEGNGPGRG